MRNDNDLLFLQECRNEDLKTLVDYLTNDKNGEIRFSEQLTNTDAYIRNYPHSLNRMWCEATNELQRYGGNTIVNLLSGHGVYYREILQDVCKKVKVAYGGFDSVERIEQKLLVKIFMDAVEDMDEEQLKAVVDELNIPTKSLKKQIILAAIQTALRRGGVICARIAIYVANMISKMLLGRGLMIMGRGAISSAVGVLAGPIGWAITIGWTVYDLSSPAYRVTIPSVIQIAYMRMMYRSPELPSLQLL